VVVRALAESPWGVFTVAATIPIALFMGGYMRFLRIGRVLEASALGVGLLLLAADRLVVHPAHKKPTLNGNPRSLRTASINTLYSARLIMLL
jgi:carbon starvation protein CstA